MTIFKVYINNVLRSLVLLLLNNIVCIQGEVQPQIAKPDAHAGLRRWRIIRRGGDGILSYNIYSIFIDLIRISFRIRFQLSNKSSYFMCK